MTSAFVGRKEALTTLQEELRFATGGASRIVWIEGDPGMGKTSLLRFFLGDHDAGRPVSWAAGAEEERLLPFGLINQLTSGRRTEGHADPLTIGAELLATWGEGNDVTLVVLDDLQWADAESASALLFTLRRVQQESLLVMVVTRPDPVVTLGESWGRLLRDGHRVRRIGLEGLSTDELVELAAVTVGTQLGSTGAERLRNHTGGHPMHASALLAELGTTALDTVHGVLPAPRSLATIILTKVATLPAPAQDLLTALAVLGQFAPIGLAAAVGRVEDPLAALETAMAVELVGRPYGGALRFEHPLVRGAIYNDLSPTRRRDLHVAAAALTHGQAALDHRILATDGPDAELARELETLGLEALHDERPALAERHFEAAAALSLDAADRDRCRLLAVEAVALGGDFSRMRALRPVVEACGETPQRRFVLGGVEFASGRLVHAEELSTRAAADIPLSPPTAGALGARAAASVAVMRVLLGRWEEAIGPARLAVEHGAGSNSLASYALAMCLCQLGRVDEVKATLTERYGEEPHRGMLPGMVRLWSDDLIGGVNELAIAVRPDQAGRAPRLLVVALCALSDAQYRLGRWDDAVVNGELAVSLARDRDQFFALQQAHAVASYIHSGRGTFTLAQDHIDAAAILAEVVPSWGTAAFLHLARAVLAQARGDASAMREAVAGLLEGSVRTALEGCASWPWRVLVADACLGVGELDEARRAVEGLERLTAQWRLSSPVTDACRLRGQLAETEGNLAAARTIYETGLAHDGELPLPTARLRIAHGRVLRQLGAKRAAIEQLRQARMDLARLGAQPYMARCDDELTACGVAAPRRSADPLDLTATELTVAHLVAQGLSNRETAARLYVSAKAVEYHLGHIYAKLGITSRRQLAAALTDVRTHN